MEPSGGLVGVAIAFAAMLSVFVPLTENGVSMWTAGATTIAAGLLMLWGATKLEKYFSKDKEEQK